MLRKLIAIVLSIAINCAVLAWFHAWSTAAVAEVAPPPASRKVLVLPGITVRPTRAQLEALRREVPQATGSVAPSGDAGVQAPAMPYYSFADDPAAADAG
jgi:hypothetical protein